MILYPTRYKMKKKIDFDFLRFIHDMTQSREVLAMMDPHTTTFGRKHGCTISRCGGFLLGAVFLLCLVATGLLVYHFAPCLEGKAVRTLDEFGENAVLQSARSFATATVNKRKIDVRLPKSVVPDSYKISLMPFIWEGNFTFNGEVQMKFSRIFNFSNFARNFEEFFAL